MIRIPGTIPIVIHPLFWLTAFIIGFLATGGFITALLAMIVVLLSVLIHEYGHALTALLFKQKPRIDLAAFGGFTYREGKRLSLGKEFLIVLNGPVFGAVLALVCYALITLVTIPYPALYFMLNFGFMVNTFWTVMNLVPVLPLDGGHLLSITLEKIFGIKGLYYAVVVGITIAILFAIIGFILGYFLIGALFLLFMFDGIRAIKYYRNFNEKDRDENLRKQLEEAGKLLEAHELEEAKGVLESLRQKTSQGVLFNTATEYLALIYKEQDQLKQSYDLLMSIKKDLSSEGSVLLHYVAYHNHQYKEVVELANQSYQLDPSGDIALINALSYGALSKAQPAIGWLECAFREGIIPSEELFSHKEFESIQNDAEFQKTKKEALEN